MLRELARGITCVLLIGAFGIALGTHGWRSRHPDLDVISSIESAHDLLQHGRIPYRGTITSFGSYAPPGLAWLFAPGVASISDPRLFGFVGSGVLHLGTLLGILLLARRYLTLPYALLAVGLYGLSEIGLFFAGALWPRGQPFVYVWMVYCVCLWAHTGTARFLTAALIIWAAGVYVFMEIAPALLIVPVVWSFYRPRIDGRAVALAGAAAIVIWYPYLRFESSRGFVDLRSQILLHDIRSTNTRTWCDPTLPTLTEQTGIRTSTAEPSGAASGAVRVLLSAGRRVLAVARGLVSNFEGAVTGIQFVMLAFAIAGLQLLRLHGRQITPARFMFAGNRGLTMLGASLIVLGIIANEVLIGRYLAPLAPNRTLVPETVATIRTLQVLAAVSGAAVLMRNSMARSFRALVTRFRPGNPETLALGLSLAVPWLLLLLLAEHGRPERFYWLLPVQVIVISACLTTLPRRFDPVVGGLLLLCALSTARLGSAVVSAASGAWAGHDDPRVPLVGFVSDRVRSSGRDHASIGYVNGEDVFEFTEHYRVGAEFDLFFTHLHGITNTNTCQEGIAPDNHYRILNTDIENRAFEGAAVKGFHFLKRFGTFDVYQRDQAGIIDSHPINRTGIRGLKYVATRPRFEGVR